MKKRILIVDDVKAVHLLYKQALKDENYDIISAERGNDALSIINKENIDLLILDLNLPDISGIDIMKKLRDEDKQIPIIILTAYGLREKVIKSAKYDIEYYLLKPVDLNLFRERIKYIFLEQKGKQLSNLKRSANDLIKDISEFSDEIIDSEIVILKKDIIKLSEKSISSELKEDKFSKFNVNNSVITEESIDLSNKKLKNIELTQNNLDNVENLNIINCPICKNKFTAKEYGYTNRDKNWDNDIIDEVYDKIIDDIEYIYICPKCLYAEEKTNFFNLTEKEKERILKRESIRRDILAGKKIIELNELESIIYSYLLAGSCYESRYKNNWFIGNFILKVGFYAKIQKKFKNEREILKYATRYFEDAFVTWEEEYGNYTRNELIYFLLIVSIKLNNYEKAMLCIDTIKKSTEIDTNHEFQELLSEKIKLVEEMRNR